MRKLSLFSLLILWSCSDNNLKTNYKIEVHSKDDAGCYVNIKSLHYLDGFGITTESSGNVSYRWKESRRTYVIVEVDSTLGSGNAPNFTIHLYREGKLVQTADNEILVWKNI